MRIVGEFEPQGGHGGEAIHRCRPRCASTTDCSRRTLSSCPTGFHRTWRSAALNRSVRLQGSFGSSLRWYLASTAPGAPGTSRRPAPLGWRTVSCPAPTPAFGVSLKSWSARRRLSYRLIRRDLGGIEHLDLGILATKSVPVVLARPRRTQTCRWHSQTVAVVGQHLHPRTMDA